MAEKRAKVPEPGPAASGPVGVLILGFGAALIGYLIRRPVPTIEHVAPVGSSGTPVASSGHVPVDLLGHSHPGPGDRPPVDFRPDPTAPIAAADRDALRPATKPV